MTTVAYYQGCLLTDRLHTFTETPWIPVRCKSSKVVVSKCKRAAMGVAGTSYVESFRQDLVDSITIGIAKHGGDLISYLKFLYTEDKEVSATRLEVFKDFGDFSLILMTKTGAISISRHEDATGADVVPRRYAPDSAVAYGTGTAPFYMLTHLGVPVEKIMPAIAANDALVSAEYDIIRPADLKPFKPVIRS